VAWVCTAGGEQAKVRLDEVPVLSSRVSVVNAAKNFGAVFDSRLSMSALATAVCRSGYYYQLRQLRPLKRYMTDAAIKTLTHAFIGSRLDYCNGLCCGISEGLLTRLESVQNTAARLVTGLGQRDWLPVRQRVRAV
jgi:hypothetical protein